MRSPDRRGSAGASWWLLRKEFRALAASHSYWLLLLVVGPLVGHAFITSVNRYAEASGIGGGSAVSSRQLSPLDGIVVPTFGAYGIVATLLLPFVVIRLFALEKQTGELALTLQAPTPFSASIAAKGLVLIGAWLAAGIAGAIALVEWSMMGGHLFAPEVATVSLGYVLRGVLTIGVGAAAGALAMSGASAVIVVLAITLGAWALDYAPPMQGGALESIAAYAPSSALRAFEHGELRVNTVLVFLTIGVAGLSVAAIWLRQGDRIGRRVRRVARALAIAVLFCFLFGQARGRWDASEDRRNSQILVTRQPPAADVKVINPGYPLAKRAPAAPWIFFVFWPTIVLLGWQWARRPSGLGKVAK